MPAPQQQQGGSSDNSLDFLWMIVLIVGGCALLWFFGRTYIVSTVLSIRLYEVYLLQYVLSGYFYIASFLHLPLPNLESLNQAMATIHEKNTNMSISQLVALSSSVGKFYTIPVMLIVVGLAVITYFTNIAEQFKHTYNMETLRKSEYKIWPQVSPVMRVDLVKKELDQGPWATSLTPLLFAKKHDLIIQHKENGKTDVSLNEGGAYRVFALQLGLAWAGPERLPIHIQALYAIFLSRANHDRKNADDLLAQIATSSTSDKLNFTGVKELVAKHKTSKQARFAEQKHAYVLTVMATLLELARTDGVLATAEFLWLKPLDRQLWYMLNAVGRQTAFPEIGGVYAHWIAEKKLDRAMKVPMVESAVKALDSAMKDMIYQPEDE